MSKRIEPTDLVAQDWLGTDQFLASENVEVDGSGDLSYSGQLGAGPESPSGEDHSGQFGLHFTLSSGSNVTLGDCVIDAGASGTLVVELWKYTQGTNNPNQGTKVDETSISVAAGEQTITLNLTTDGDGDYWVGRMSGPSMLRTDVGQAYPWTSLDGSVKFVGGRQFDGAGLNDRWYYFFDLQVDQLVFYPTWRASNGWDPSVGTVGSSKVSWAATGDAGAEVAVSETDPTSVYFDGVDDDISVTADSGLVASSYTWEVWFRLLSDGSSNNYINILSMAAGNDTRIMEMWVADGEAFGSPDGLLYFRIADETGSTIANVIDDSQNYRDGEWHHIGAIWESGLQELVVDGQSVGSNTTDITAPHQHSTAYLRIGWASDVVADNRYFEGNLSEVRLWGAARTVNEIADNRYMQLSGSETGIIGLWKLDEGTGSTAEDSASSPGNDGTITGASWADGESPLYLSATNGESIPGVSQGDDLTGLKLYGRQLLHSTNATMQSFTLEVSTDEVRRRYNRIGTFRGARL